MEEELLFVKPLSPSFYLPFPLSYPPSLSPTLPPSLPPRWFSNYVQTWSKETCWRLGRWQCEDVQSYCNCNNTNSVKCGASDKLWCQSIVCELQWTIWFQYSCHVQYIWWVSLESVTEDTWQCTAYWDECTSLPPLPLCLPPCLPPCLNSLLPLPGNVKVDGPLQNMTVESGTTVRLTCTQESKETTDITYTWSREGGIPLPDGVQVNNVCVCVCVCGCVGVGVGVGVCPGCMTITYSPLQSHLCFSLSFLSFHSPQVSWRLWQQTREIVVCTYVLLMECLLPSHSLLKAHHQMVHTYHIPCTE